MFICPKCQSEMCVKDGRWRRRQRIYTRVRICINTLCAYRIITEERFVRTPYIVEARTKSWFKKKETSK